MNFFHVDCATSLKRSYVFFGPEARTRRSGPDRPGDSSCPVQAHVILPVDFAHVDTASCAASTSRS